MSQNRQHYYGSDSEQYQQVFSISNGHFGFGWYRIFSHKYRLGRFIILRTWMVWHLNNLWSSFHLNTFNKLDFLRNGRQFICRMVWDSVKHFSWTLETSLSHIKCQTDGLSIVYGLWLVDCREGILYNKNHSIGAHNA